MKQKLLLSSLVLTLIVVSAVSFSQQQLFQGQVPKLHFSPPEPEKTLKIKKTPPKIEIKKPVPVDPSTLNPKTLSPTLPPTLPTSPTIPPKKQTQDPPFVPAPTSDTEMADMRKAFEAIRSHTVFPVATKSIEDIEDTFGPRVQKSKTRLDWHRGIDVDATLGTPVIAATDGEFLKIDNFESGGLTVFIRHTFPTPVNFKGKTLRYYYTVYMHLDSVAPELKTAKAGFKIAKGQQIGTVGHSGAEVDHLHFELRVGTYCSLEFQLNNKSSSCAKDFMFDPHMHPMLLFAPLEESMQVQFVGNPTKGQDVNVLVTLPDEQPLINRIEFQLVDTTKKQVITSNILDYNQRLGYDASSTSLLDTQNKEKLYVSPIKFTDASSEYQTQIVIPKTFIESGKGDKAVVMVTDVWGRTKYVEWDVK